MTIPYSTQTIDQSDIDAVERVLKSEFLTQGPVTPLFEGRVAEYCDSDFSISFNSATSALHAACMALGVGDGDLVWTTAISFVATANCAALCGAKVDFVDIDPTTINLSIDCLEAKLANAELTGCLPKVLIPVHFAGNPVDMRSLGDLKEKYGFMIIEDASHAFGASQYGRKIGNSKYSEITVFSFHAVKVITTGEGGIATTNDPEINEKLQLIRSHGVTRNHRIMQQSNFGAWYYEQSSLGYNYRLSDIHAALGLSQINKIESFTQLRNQAAEIYKSSLEGMPVMPIRVDDHNLSSYHLFVVRFEKQLNKEEYEAIFTAMRNENILVNHHYIPIYKHPYYDSIANTAECPEADKYFMNALSLPLFPLITESQIEFTVRTLKSTLNRCLP